MQPWELFDRQFSRLKKMLVDGYLTEQGYEALHYDLCRAMKERTDMDPKPGCDDPDCPHDPPVPPPPDCPDDCCED